MLSTPKQRFEGFSEIAERCDDNDDDDDDSTRLNHHHYCNMGSRLSTCPCALQEHELTEANRHPWVNATDATNR
jgi:hypothetical protein